MNLSDIELLEQLAIAEARESFWAYRRYMNPKMKLGWWQREVAAVLQRFFDELIAGLRPMYVIQAPPQHGKSIQIIDFVAWLAGRRPDLRTIYTSFSERLGVRANLRMQRTLDSEKYRRVFPETQLNGSSVPTIGNQALRNREILEYAGYEGFFRNTTVRGAITGEGLDLGVIDDPIKGRIEANSPTVRDACWDWLTDDFLTRFSEEAGLLAILTRWHEDDPIGRLIEKEPRVKVYSYPAIAVQKEAHREIGEALFPQHKSIEFLESRKAVMQPAYWESLYQQNPRPLEGTLFSEDKFLVDGLPVDLPARCDQVYAVIDTALKDGREHDGTAVTYFARNKLFGHPLTILDWDIIQIKGALLEDWLPSVNHRLEDFARRTNARQGNVGMWIEDKASGIVLLQQAERRQLPAYPIEEKLVDLGKEGRALSVSGYTYRGDVKICRDAYDKVTTYKGQTRNHLISQVCGFCIGTKTPHQMDLLDTFTYGVAISLGDSEGW